MTTAISHLITDLTANQKDTAAKNGMTTDQFAASMTLRNKDVTASAECRQVLADKEQALAALDRIALIPETEAGSPYIPSDLLIASILNK